MSTWDDSRWNRHGKQGDSEHPAAESPQAAENGDGYAVDSPGAGTPTGPWNAAAGSGQSDVASQTTTNETASFGYTRPAHSVDEQVRSSWQAVGGQATGQSRSPANPVSPAPATFSAPQAAQYTGGYQRPYSAPSSPGVGAPEPRNMAPEQRYWGVEQRPVKKKKNWGGVIAVALVAGLVGGAGGAGITHGLMDSPTSQSAATERQTEVRTVASDSGVNWAAVAAEVEPSVVAIESRGQGSASSGSGVIIDTDGHIITNHHVIASARQIQVTLSDGTIHAAEVVGSDASTDLAVLKLVSVPDNLVPARMGTSEDLVVGEPVVAIGNPLGLSSTVTTGIISALDRPVVTREDSGSDPVVTNAIQIDAAINPGNSGGPLFNAEGEVIGINSSIASLSSDDGGTAGSIGLGFAIPIDLVTRVVDDLLEDGSVDHAFIGVTTTSDIVNVDGQSQVGARVVEVSGGSPAEDAGITMGDAIVSINGQQLASNTALTGYVRQYAPGETIQLDVVRDGNLMNIELVLGQRG